MVTGRWNANSSALGDVADSKPIDWAARAGLTARGVVWIIIGILGFLLAQGARSKSADQKGALQELLTTPYGTVTVAAMTVGFVGYALWRLSEAINGVAGEGKRTGPRLQSAARSVIYFVLAGTAVSALLGSGESQASQQESLTARVMGATGGRLLIGLVGLVVLAVGVTLIVEGWKLKFMRYFRSVPPEVHRIVVNLGRVGTMGRGSVFSLAGVLVVIAAWTADPEKARGLDGALRTLLEQPYGTVLAVIASLALIAFGIYGLAEARWRRV